MFLVPAIVAVLALPTVHKVPSFLIMIEELASSNSKLVIESLYLGFTREVFTLSRLSFEVQLFVNDIRYRSIKNAASPMSNLVFLVIFELFFAFNIQNYPDSDE